MNIDNLLIEENDIEIAQNICKTIDEAQLRNRAVSNVLGANIAVKFFEGEGLDLDIKSGLHNVGRVLEDIDIADAYLKGSYIDIRTYFDDDKIFVPKAHFDNNLLPAAYMFIKISSDLSGALVGGFILPENVDTQNEENGFYKIDENALVSYYDIEPGIITVEDSYSVDEEQIYSYLDNKIENKSEFYSELIKSKDARMKLMSFAKAQYVFNFVSVVEDVKAPALENSNDFELVSDSSEDFLLEEDNTFELGSDNTDMLEEDLSENDFEAFDELNSLDSLLETEEIETHEETVVDDNLLESLNSEEVIIEDDIDSFESSDSENENIVSELFSSKSGFDFETTVTPSMQEFEENENLEIKEDVVEESSLDIEDFDKTSENPLEFIEDNEETEENTIEDNSVIEDEENTDAQEQIDTLFDSEEAEAEAETDDNIEKVPPKKSTAAKPLLILLLLLLIGGAGYFGYSKFMAPSPIEDTQTMPDNEIDPKSAVEPKQQEEVMPIESVETQPTKVTQNEGNNVSIPAIEQNLDASIIVSNLSVAWEVPSGYAANTSASRLLTKLGKIIQLNLKTELLLLSKPPITNKISVEVKFNNSTKKFETVGIVTSSGEKSVDDLILQTVNRVLDMNLNINTDSFGKLQGNPVLIIKL